MKKSQDRKDTGYAALRRAGYAHHLFAFKKVMGYRIHLMDKTAMLCACSVKK